MLMDFKDKVILITGASSGIGRELALLFAKQQAKLILASRNTQVLKAVQALCLVHTPYCQVLTMDMTNTEQVMTQANTAIFLYGRIDILINNAGVTQRSSIIDTPLAIDRHIMETNFFGPVALTKALLPQFLMQQSGHIVVISSMAGLYGYPQRSAYAASKHALQGFFETLQTEQPIPELYTTLVCPGRIKTPLSLSAVTATGAPHGQMDKGQLNGIPVATCARKIMQAILHKKKIILIAREEKWLLWIKRCIPALFYTIARKGK
jgi:dehydrogenase/reductase SDR family protein 7B